MYYLKRNPIACTKATTALKRKQKQVHPRVRLSRDTGVKVTPVARPLITPVAQKLSMCERGVFTSRICVHSRSLLLVMKHCVSVSWQGSTEKGNSTLTGNKISGHMKCLRQEICPVSDCVDRWDAPQRWRNPSVIAAEIVEKTVPKKWQLLIEWQKSWNFCRTDSEQCITCNNEMRLQKFNIVNWFRRLVGEGVCMSDNFFFSDEARSIWLAT
jgi:hypothetical protein